MIRLRNHLIVIASLLFLTACADPSPTLSYRAVVDAGSSGSRIHLYQASRNSEGMVITDVAQLESAGGDGLSSYQAQSEQAGPQAMQPLLQALNDWLLARRIGRDTVPVDVLATAGMRLLEQNDAPAAQAIYRSVRRAILGNGYRAGELRTISGDEEGLYAWADVNYLHGNFQPGHRTAGLVEVGGASAQVAYETSQRDHPHARAVTIAGTSYTVLSVSFLGLGQNEARKAMILASGPKDNPCYPNNDRGSPPGGLDAGAILSGNYRYGRCEDLYQTVVSAFQVRDKVIAAGFGGDFIGIASVYHALNNWHVLDRPSMLSQMLERQCGGTDAWSLKVVPAQGGTSGFAQTACANGTFINTLLFDPRYGLGLSGERIHAVGQINGQSPSWTRGYLLIGASR
ncbi:hypothetical protein KTQ42_02695|uniref:hypothetical protein n=1 Tax=Noviherbaspirillum sp. L7-7A TaxID=2850560 RepID=UPI001C2C76EE|nr:hypothetical protein [Noviherbaspirillum sp. L7-7A]MBV0878213.1 hypothetical protein [Noviherbaspirillum sp. L7-7A]